MYAGNVMPHKNLERLIDAFFLADHQQLEVLESLYL